jgi:hypothetical protein
MVLLGGAMLNSETTEGLCTKRTHPAHPGLFG